MWSLIDQMTYFTYPGKCFTHESVYRIVSCFVHLNYGCMDYSLATNAPTILRQIPPTSYLLLLPQALSLVGPQSIEEMKNLAVEMFSDIKFRGDVADVPRSVSFMNTSQAIAYLHFFDFNASPSILLIIAHLKIVK
jgi:hypothetical protein